MVVVRAEGESHFLIPAVGVDAAARDTSARGGPGAQLGRWLKPVCRGQWGINLKEWTQHTRFEREATDENTTAAPGSMRYDLFLYGTAGKLEDLPEGSAWSRRAITRRDFIQLNPVRLHRVRGDRPGRARDVRLRAGARRRGSALATGRAASPGRRCAGGRVVAARRGWPVGATARGRGGRGGRRGDKTTGEPRHTHRILLPLGPRGPGYEGPVCEGRRGRSPCIPVATFQVAERAGGGRSSRVP